MHIMEKFLDDCIKHVEWCMDMKPVKDMSAKEKDYISHCEDLILKTMAVLAGKKAYDKHIPHDHQVAAGYSPLMANKSMYDGALNL